MRAAPQHQPSALYEAVTLCADRVHSPAGLHPTRQAHVSVGIFAARDVAMPELSPESHVKRVVHV